MNMGYDEIHNISSKVQVHDLVASNGRVTNQAGTTYNWTYGYTGTQAHAPINIGNRTFSYDYNGNQTGWLNNSNNTQRNIVWDDENRIQSVSDGGSTSTYKYDYTGQRVIKTGSAGETAYANQFYVVSGGGKVTKHVFAGTTRVATRIQGSTARDNFLYYYHPDHLGSTQYVTEANGAVYEHVEYFPFGETWVNEGGGNINYFFTSKELDVETNLYYFGARYYDPRTSVFQSVDPIIGSYLSGKPNGGVFNSVNLSLFSYTAQNPVRFIDPTGQSNEDYEKANILAQNKKGFNKPENAAHAAMDIMEMETTASKLGKDAPEMGTYVYYSNKTKKYHFAEIIKSKSKETINLQKYSTKLFVDEDNNLKKDVNAIYSVHSHGNPSNKDDMNSEEYHKDDRKADKEDYRDLTDMKGCCFKGGYLLTAQKKRKEHDVKSGKVTEVIRPKEPLE